MLGLVAERMLRHQGIELSLDILEIDKVFPHEETFDPVVRRLATRLLREGVQADPILVDKESHAVLDGMHRLAALESIGARRVLSCLLDYQDDSIKVFRWLRFIPVASSLLLSRLKSELQLSSVDSPEQAVSQVEDFNAPLALLLPSETLLSRKPVVDPVHSYLEVRRFDTIIRQTGASSRSLTEKEAQALLRSGRGCVLYPPPISKKDVVACSAERNLLPPKTTRHVIPFRPVGIRLPLRLLIARSVTLEAAKHRLREMLDRLTCNISSPGSRYRGKVYPDRLLIFGGDV